MAFQAPRHSGIDVYIIFVANCMLESERLKVSTRLYIYITIYSAGTLEAHRISKILVLYICLCTTEGRQVSSTCSVS